MLKNKGYEIHVACNGSEKIQFVDKIYRIPFSRNPINRDNIIAYKELKKVLLENNYDLIHCHTPASSFITRLAAIKSRKKGSIVIYTAHGFHFFRGAKLINWLIYFPVEVIMSFFTDAIITMNEEDYTLLRSKWFRCRDKYYTDGIGINPDRLQNRYKGRKSVRHELGIKDSDIVFLYIAEFNKRKNHKFLFKNLHYIFSQNQNIKFLFAGGFSTEKKEMEEISIKEGFSDNVIFLGYQDDIGKFILASDVGVSSSTAEGLPIGVCEIMFNNIPVIASRIRGHVDLISHGYNGYLFDLNDNETFRSYILEMAENINPRKTMGLNAKGSISKFFLKNTLVQLEDIYNNYLHFK